MADIQKPHGTQTATINSDTKPMANDSKGNLRYSIDLSFRTAYANTGPTEQGVLDDGETLPHA